TGAAGGIGRASAVLLAEAGAAVHCADLDEKGLLETLGLITSAGGEAHTHPLDVTDRNQVRAAVSAAGELDILAAVAGIMHTSSVLETTDEDLDRVLSVNFKGVLYACQEVARTMVARSSAGSLITMASGAVDSASPGLLCYIAPGWIRTPMTARHDSEQQHRAEATMARISPLGRVGEPDEVAHTVLHLAADASAFMTGQILRPNGGVAMPW
ncbi:SDR family oxidoreductase, partial [Streptomyces sp. P01-B04]|uniref:SDR family NAD(P)-dependent oxidoreductase n=1 Tax=Streptomyces poriferorum TaxID=2798799 RepID=UPI001C6001D7